MQNKYFALLMYSAGLTKHVYNYSNCRVEDVREAEMCFPN